MLDFFNKGKNFDKIVEIVNELDDFANYSVKNFNSDNVDFVKIRDQITKMLSMLKELHTKYSSEIPYFEPDNKIFTKLGRLIESEESDFPNALSELRKYLTKHKNGIIEGSLDNSEETETKLELSKLKRYTLNLINHCNEIKILTNELKKQRRTTPIKPKKVEGLNTKLPVIDRSKFRIFINKKFLSKSGTDYRSSLNIIINILIHENYNPSNVIRRLTNVSHRNGFSERLSHSKGLFQTHITSPETFYWFIKRIGDTNILLVCERFDAEHVNIIGKTQEEYDPPTNLDKIPTVWAEYNAAA